MTKKEVVVAGQNQNMEDSLSYEDVKQYFRDQDAPVVTAREIAEKFSISRQAAKYRLDKLHERGEVQRKVVGSSAVVWWLTEDSQSGK